MRIYSVSPRKTECPWPGLKPGLLNPEMSALIMRPLCLSLMLTACILMLCIGAIFFAQFLTNLGKIFRNICAMK